jgi:hypothetical protein
VRESVDALEGEGAMREEVSLWTRDRTFTHAPGDAPGRGATVRFDGGNADDSFFTPRDDRW